ncbi:lantibiotic dehydratase C-terminal domain-containing protein [Nonomuraea turcica]|uniref:lantibiotic dehydratase C-terminal domain-containing protein n=1 Tax=Nonomuraea sp. G32 TaxID=3067274 RepID=UPI00273C4E2A|nr:lantibiotic dehydratase C-terminal domain-containing protein [Nonomuraea sp. G32]MDP4503533.1 lantibiotic dehydratase C-terminal domain-containing protein [Nonomuraea sp. G32]
MDEARWVSAHAFYHDDLDQLLVHAVAPLAAELTGRGLATDFFFLRCWDGGNHLRLRILPEPAVERGDVETVISERLGEFFAARPSTTAARQKDYERMAALLARQERVSSYSRSLYPDNSLLLVPYRREHGRHRDGPAVRAVERHFVESSRLALDMLVDGLTPGERATAAYAMTCIAWFTSVPEPQRLAELVRAAGRSAEHVGLLDKGRALESQREQAITLARRIRTAENSGALATWARSVTALRETLTSREGRRDAGGSAFAVMDRCARLLCNRLGVPLVEEESLRHLATEAVEALANDGATA